MPKRKRAERDGKCDKNDLLVKEAIESVCMRPVSANEVKEVVLTPLELQVTSLRQSVPPNTILFVACGYKAKVFGRDAHVVSRRCGVCCIPAHPFEYASCPYTRVNLYIHRLVTMGYHVVFADQESAAIRAVEKIKSKVFTRSLSRIYSRGTLLPDENVGGASAENSTGASMEEYKSKNNEDDNSEQSNNNKHNNDNDNDDNNDNNEQSDVTSNENEHDIHGVPFNFMSWSSNKNSWSELPGEHNLHENSSVVEVITEHKRNCNIINDSIPNEMENNMGVSNRRKMLNKTINWDGGNDADTDANLNNETNLCFNNYDSVVVVADMNDNLSESFICFIGCTHVDINSTHSEHSEIHSATPVQIILVDFITRQRVSVNVTTALEFDDLLSQHEIVEFVVLLRTAPSSTQVEETCTSHCCSSEKTDNTTKNRNYCVSVTQNKNMIDKNFEFHLTYRSNEGYCYKPAKHYLNSLPSYIRKALESNYQLNFGPTRTGEEDNSGNISFNGFACSHLQNWNHIVQSYLESYGFSGVYEEMRNGSREEDEMESCKTCLTSPTEHTANGHEPNSINKQQQQHTISNSNINQMRTMRLPGNTLRALDVFPSSQRNLREMGSTAMDECANNNYGNYCSNHYSLFNLLDYSLTACGKRLLHRWVASPLTCMDDIYSRQDAVTFLVNNYFTSSIHKLNKCKELSASSHNESKDRLHTHVYTETAVVVSAIKSLLSSTRQVGDVEGVVSKIQAGRCTVREFVRLLQLVQFIYKLVDEITYSNMSSFECAREMPSDATNNETNKNNGTTKMTHIPELIGRQLHVFHSTPVKELIVKYDTVIQKNPSSALEFFLSNVHSISDALQEQVHARQHAQERLERELLHIRRQVHLPELEYRTIGGTPFVIDLPLLHSHKVPRDWTVLTRTKSNVRFHTEEIVHAYTALSAANARATALSVSDWTHYQHEFVNYHIKINLYTLSRVIESVSILDALQCLAKASSRAGYVRPIFVNTTTEMTTASHVNSHQSEIKDETDNINSSNTCKEVYTETENQADNASTYSSSFDHCKLDKNTFTSDSHSGAFIFIEHGRHPLMDVMLQHRYVASSMSMPIHGGWILTGPNMGGKSALMRMMGLFVILAQMGCYVPARRATLPVFTAIHCRMGASDAILEGSSTFLNEMNETARILRSPNLNTSLVLMDELGRGTSSFDGAAVAAATLSYLLQQRTTFIFVTHFNYICEEYITNNRNEECRNSSVSTKEMNKMKNSSEVSMTHSYEKPESAMSFENHNDSNGIEAQKGDVECYYMGFRKRIAQWQEKATIQSTQEQFVEHQSSKSSIIFTYQPEKGITPSSFGVDVAAMAGLPASLLTEAHILSTTAEKLQQYRSSLDCIKCFMR